ncbi:MAG: histidine kinase [Polyangiaceae bacterium]
MRLTIIVAAAALPALLLLLLTAVREHEEAEQEVVRKAKLAAARIVTSESLAFAEARRALAVLRQMLSSSSDDPQACERAVKLVWEPDGVLLSVGVFRPEGTALCNARAPLNVDFRAQPWFASALQANGLFIGDPFVNPVNGELVLGTSFTERGADGRVIRVLAAPILLGKLAREIEAEALPSGSTASLWREDGTLLARYPTDTDFINKKFRESPFDQSLRAGGEAFEALGIDGVRRVYVAERLKATPGGPQCLVGVPIAHVTQAGWRRSFGDLGPIAFATLLAGGLGWWLSERLIRRPAGELAGAARKLARGERAANVARELGGTELGDVAKAFDEMALAIALHETELRRRADQLSLLVQEVHTAREEEATRIAREVHDVLGQNLTAAQLDLGTMKRLVESCALRGDEKVSMNERISGLSELVKSTHETVRRIASELRPSVLTDLGLAPAVEWQAQELERRTGIAVKVDTSTVPDLPPKVSLAVFRILQEMLTNVTQHAQAEHVDIELAYDGETLVLEVRDDGVGIDESALVAGSSLGILGMRERAVAVGGEVSIRRLDDGGTLARVTVEVSA